MTGLPAVLAVAGVVGAGLVGGVYFTFSSFVMKGLADLPDPQGIAAMQAINRAAVTPLFMTALFGTAAVSIGLAVVAVRRWGDASSYWLLAGSGSYLVGIVLTAGYHVPRNDALALVDPSGVDAGTLWATYVSDWTTWNHVRTVSALAATFAFTLALSTD